MLGKAIYEKIQENRHAKIQKAIAQGESNVINALTKLAKASKGEITVEQAIETCKVSLFVVNFDFAVRDIHICACVHPVWQFCSRPKLDTSSAW